MATELQNAAQGLFTRWCDALAGRLAPDGSLPCGVCGMPHGRSCELALPFTVRWRQTRDARWLDAAASAVAWAERNVAQPDGSYLNEPVNESWKGTTEFALIAIAKAIAAGGGDLPDGLRDEWLSIVSRQTRFLQGWFAQPGFSVNVNYRAAHALAMELAAPLLGEPALHAQGAAEARRCLDLISPRDGLLFGEFHPMEAVSPRGVRGVDLGYNLEETLPLLAEWAARAGDRAALARILASAGAHLAFVLPDGAIDNSCGTRSHKWTYWGSRTSDGVLPLLAAMAREGDALAIARIPAVLGLYRRCTTPEGLLAGGPHYAAAGEPVCIHHTLCHAKALADCLLESVPAASPAQGACNSAPPAASLAHYPTLGAHIALCGPWRATFSESDMCFHETPDEAVGGGCLSLLWNESAGPVFAATMARYRITELWNMQLSATDRVTRCLTPRIETPDGIFMSQCDFNASFSIGARDGGGATVSASGRLVSCDGAAGPEFTLRHTIDASGLAVEATCCEPARLVLPVVALPGDAVAFSPDGLSATIARRSATIRITAGGALSRLPSGRSDGLAFCPSPGFLCLPLSLAIAPGRPATASVQAVAAGPASISNNQGETHGN